MALDARKMRILQAIIDDYVLTAAPVGSRTVSKQGDINLSSATIRNEMSNLTEMGYLEQPHTSSGRIPSSRAYRLYVNNIMRKARLTRDEINYIRSHYSKRLDEVDDVVRQTALVLSNITQYTSMVLSPQLRSVRLKYIHIVPIGANKALAIIVTDAGITREAVIRVPQGIKQDELERIGKVLTKRFENCRLEDITLKRLPELYTELGENKDFFDELLHSLAKSVDVGRAVELYGTTNILNYPEYSDVDRAKSLLHVIESKDLLYSLLTDATNVEFSIKIGDENEAEQFHDCSVVTATYRIGDASIGSFGVIGPTRMNYSRVVSLMSLIGNSFSEVLTNMLEKEQE